ncbi:MAG: hypothetical protein C5B57_05760 [Blastocatellia bacterium]|nr:MAG: hypothetical protein C5B57_05760 [Blastocatellia bacterium]
MGFSTSGRWQFDATPRAAIVGSAFYRHSTDLDPQSGVVGGAFGFSPSSRVSIWTEVDADLQSKALGGHSLVIVNETAVETYRGIWLKVSPQFRRPDALGFPDLRRLAFEADLLPRTHWNVGVSYYHDRAFDTSTATVLVQLTCTCKSRSESRSSSSSVSLIAHRTRPESGFTNGSGSSWNLASMKRSGMARSAHASLRSPNRLALLVGLILPSMGQL